MSEGRPATWLAYRLIATLAVLRGFDPDNAAFSRKVTETH
jgi:hypothetical protein